MASTLDMLDNVHGGGRDFLAEQIVAGASNAQMADALAAKFGIDPPSIRAVSHWANHDKPLLAAVAKLREGGASPARAHSTVIAALERRLENADKLSTDELLAIEKAIRRHSGRSTPVADSEDATSSGISRAALDAWFQSMAYDYADPECARFREALDREDAAPEELIEAMPADADERLEQCIEDWDGRHLSSI